MTNRTRGPVHTKVRAGSATGAMTRPITRPIPHPADTAGLDASGPVPFSRRRTRVLLGLVAIAVVAALVGALFVLPFRAWMNQREAIAQAEEQKDALWRQIRELDDRYVALESESEIERIAREQYGLVFPGEQPLSVLPAPTVSQLPAAWPYTVVEDILAVRTATGSPAAAAETSATAPATDAPAAPTP